MNFIADLLQRLSSSLSLVVATSATAVSYFTMNDVAVIFGIISTIILSIMNWSRHKQLKIRAIISNQKDEQIKIKVSLEIKKLKLENEKLILENHKLRKSMEQ